VSTPVDGTDFDCVPGTRHFGNLGRNSLRGPAFKELNFSFSKRTSITERLNLVLEADLFNILNHPNFSNPTLPNLSPMREHRILTPGRVPLDDRTGPYSLAATGDVGIGNPFLGSGGPRGVQFAAKIIF